jgi:hypothetical protein
MIKVVFCSILFLGVLSSCATLFTGNKSIIHFSSDVPNAEVFINDEAIGETPVTAKIKRSLKSKEVRLEKVGYEPQSFVLKKKFKPISLLGTTLIFVDVASGAIVDYPDNFFHLSLKPETTTTPIPPSRELKNHFYVITKVDTFFTQPFYEFEQKSFWNSDLDKMTFKLLDGSSKEVPVEDIVMYKTLNIHRKGIGKGFLAWQTNMDHITKIYIPAKHSETKRKSRYMFMEALLGNGDHHLVKSLVNVTNVNMAPSGVVQTSSYNVPYFYLYKEGEVVSVIKQRHLLSTIEQYFGDEKDLITALKKKNKFKTLETYVYGDKRRVDRYYSPF